MKTTRELREEYINRMRELQKKHKENRENFFIIALLLAYFVDYIENKNEYKMMLVAPFIPNIKNIDKVKVVVKAIDEGLSYRGKLEEHIKTFKKINEKTLSSLNSIIPQIDLKKKSKGDKLANIERLNDTEVLYRSNQTDLLINSTFLNKTMKQWNTQRDSKVRRTIFHINVDRMAVKINELFIVGDYSAMFPSDLGHLPPFDAYGCRCYLTYFN